MVLLGANATRHKNLCENLRNAASVNKKTFSGDFCAVSTACENEQCFEVPPPDDDCDGTSVPPKCCVSVNGESLAPDY